MWCLPLCPPDWANGYPQKYSIPRPVPENIEKILVLEPAEQGQKICFQPTGKDAIQTTEELDRTRRQRKQVCSLLGSSVSYLHLALSHQDYRSKVDPIPIPYKSPSGLIGDTESVPQVLRPPDTLDHTMAFLCLPSRVLCLHDGASPLPYKSPYIAITILLVLFLCKHPNTVCCCTSY